MKNSDIRDPLFSEAVTAIDEGNVIALKALLDQHPRLVQEPLDYDSGDYFDHPWLIWFVADNPIRIPALAPTALSILKLLVEYVKKLAPDTAARQLDYTLGLIATGRIPNESGLQIAMMDLLMDEGVPAKDAMGALTHGNIAAVERLLERGAPLTLPVAVGLNRLPDILHLVAAASGDDKLTAVAVAAFYGNADMVAFLLDLGFEHNGYPSAKSGFHSHATPLHQAVYSGSAGAVELLADAGAKLDVRDKIYGGTPLGWAEHMAHEAGSDKPLKKSYEQIADFLRRF